MENDYSKNGKSINFEKEIVGRVLTWEIVPIQSGNRDSWSKGVLAPNQLTEILLLYCLRLSPCSAFSLAHPPSLSSESKFYKTLWPAWSSREAIPL